MRKSVLVLVFIVLLLASCADAVEIDQCLPPEPGPYGFWSGLWHGLIAPIAFVVSLFSDSVAVYAVNNTGGWYDFGFLLGFSWLGVGSGRAKKSKRS